MNLWVIFIRPVCSNLTVVSGQLAAQNGCLAFLDENNVLTIQNDVDLT